MSINAKPVIIDVRECTITGGFYTRALVAEILLAKREYESKGCITQLRGILRKHDTGTMQVLQLGVFEG